MRSPVVSNRSEGEQPFQITNLQSIKNSFQCSSPFNHKLYSPFTAKSKQITPKNFNFNNIAIPIKKQNKDKCDIEQPLIENNLHCQRSSIKFNQSQLSNQDEFKLRESETKIYPSTTRFKEEFDKLETRIFSGRRASNSISYIQAQESQREIHRSSQEKNKVLNFRLALDFEQNDINVQMKENKKQMLQELNQIDMHNNNLQLQQENETQKKQLQVQQQLLRHNEKVIKKQKLTIQQLTSFNNQLKNNNEQLQNQITKLNQDLFQEKFLKENIQKELLIDKEKLQQFVQLEKEIKQIEEFYLELLSKLSREIKEQSNQIQRCQEYVKNLNEFISLMVKRDDIPLDILFRYKQIPNITNDQSQLQNLDMLEALQGNNQSIKQIQEKIKNIHELVTTQYVEEYSRILTKQ